MIPGGKGSGGARGAFAVVIGALAPMAGACVIAACGAIEEAPKGANDGGLGVGDAASAPETSPPPPNMGAPYRRPQDDYPKAAAPAVPPTCNPTIWSGECGGPALTLDLPATIGISKLDGGCVVELHAEERDGGAFACLIDGTAECYGPLAVGVPHAFHVDHTFDTFSASGEFSVRFGVDLDGGALRTATFSGCFDTSSGPARCASPDTPIATPDGERAIDSLVVGDVVYSSDGRGFVAARVERIVRVPALRHRVVRVTFEGGGALAMSAPHPTADGRTLGDVRAGEDLGGRRVTAVETIDYPFPYTVDILPSSTSGTYVAAGAVVGSTLRRRTPF